MAGKRTGKVELPLDTIIEVVAIKDGKTIKKEMTYGEALKLKPKNGWTYKNFQRGFSQF